MIFLDRDGTINRKPPEGSYVTRPEELELLPGAARAIRRFNAARRPVVVVTNQRGVALGRMTLSDVDAVHARLAELLAAEGARLDGVYVCPHEDGACDCRKPAPGLLLRAAREHGAALADAVMIGDSESDVEAGRRAGARSILLGPGGLAAAVDEVLA